MELEFAGGRNGIAPGTGAVGDLNGAINGDHDDQKGVCTWLRSPRATNVNQGSSGPILAGRWSSYAWLLRDVWHLYSLYFDGQRW